MCVPKMAGPRFPNVKFRFFPLSSFWSGGGVGGGGGLLLVLSAVLLHLAAHMSNTDLQQTVRSCVVICLRECRTLSIDGVASNPPHMQLSIFHPFPPLSSTIAPRCGWGMRAGKEFVCRLLPGGNRCLPFAPPSALQDGGGGYWMLRYCYEELCTMSKRSCRAPELVRWYRVVEGLFRVVEGCRGLTSEIASHCHQTAACAAQC